MIFNLGIGGKMFKQTVITKHQNLIKLQHVFTSCALCDTVKTFNLQILSIFANSQKM